MRVIRKIMFCALTGIALCSCESVIYLNGIVTDANNVPLDSVIITSNGVRVRTDSAGRFKFISMAGWKHRGEMNFLFSRKGFIESRQKLKINTDSIAIIILKREK